MAHVSVQDHEVVVAKHEGHGRVRGEAGRHGLCQSRGYSSWKPEIPPVSREIRMASRPDTVAEKRDRPCAWFCFARTPPENVGHSETEGHEQFVRGLRRQLPDAFEGIVQVGLGNSGGARQFAFRPPSRVDIVLCDIDDLFQDFGAEQFVSYPEGVFPAEIGVHENTQYPSTSTKMESAENKGLAQF